MTAMPAGRVAAGLLAAALLVLPLAATGQQFRDWTVLASEAGRCLLHQRVVAKAAGLTIADVFLRPADAGGLMISVQVPVGASLATGMAYRHPGSPRAVPLVWQSCNAETCLAQVEVDAEERGRLQRGLRVEMAFIPVVGARPLRFQVSLLGLTAALGAASCKAGG